DKADDVLWCILVDNWILIGTDDHQGITSISDQDESQRKQDGVKDGVFLFDGILDAIHQCAKKKNAENDDSRSEGKSNAVNHEDLKGRCDARQSRNDQVVDDNQGNTSEKHGEDCALETWLAILFEIIN